MVVVVVVVVRACCCDGVGSGGNDGLVIHFGGQMTWN